MTSYYYSFRYLHLAAQLLNIQLFNRMKGNFGSGYNTQTTW
jgi:hypothetical protein